MSSSLFYINPKKLLEKIKKNKNKDPHSPDNPGKSKNICN